MGSWLLDLLYPPKCILCHKLLQTGEDSICRKCADNLPERDGADPHVRFAQQCVATFRYENAMRESILRFKFSGLQFYAVQYGKWMAVTIRDKLDGQYDLISWVPVSRKRRSQRGYDQAQLLCAAVAKELGLQPTRTLEKIIHNPAQSGLQDASMRAGNVAGVYRPLQPERFAGKRILLIDDIVTTGATLSECCRVLLTAGAERVVCAVLATPPEEHHGKGESG